MRTPMAATYFDDDWTDTGTMGTSTSCGNYITITNSSSTTATITTSSTGSGVFVNSGGQWYTYPTPPQQPAPQLTPKQQALRDPRILNRYLNASDLLEQFIKDLAPLGVKQAEVLNVPLELFINWLIVKAAEEDDHVVDDVPMLPSKLQRMDRCRCCGQFLPMAQRKPDLLFKDGEHFNRYLAKQSRACAA